MTKTCETHGARIGGATPSSARLRGAGARLPDESVVSYKPSDEFVGYAYRGLGTVAIYSGDTKAAAKWYKLYLPYADPASKKQIEIILRRNGEEPSGSNR